MCEGIRALQRDWRKARNAVAVAVSVDATLPQYAPTPIATVQHMMELMPLDSSDVLWDAGCGDGGILLAAVRHFDCKCIGTEIDPVKADAARLNVTKAGLDHMITIFTGDVLDFKPADYGVTAATAYLYPDLLEKLAPTLQQIPIVATPYHAVPGLPMKQFGDVWIYDRDAVNREQAGIVNVRAAGSDSVITLKRTANPERFQLVP